jgi:hypothetical protein
MPTIPPDPDSLEQWKQLPQNTPSKDALPPMTGGLRWVGWLLIIVAIVIIFGLLQGRS